MTSKLILVLGGARAGKSTFALRLAKQIAGDGSVTFIATAQALDEEMAQRIARHREERPSHWTTIEEPHHLDEALIKAANSDVALVDCLTLFTSNWLLREDEQTLNEVSNRFLANVRSQPQTVIVVSNEVGLGLVPETPLGRHFRDLLGHLNQQFAEAADEVYLLVAGLPLRLKPRD